LIPYLFLKSHHCKEASIETNTRENYIFFYCKFLVFYLKFEISFLSKSTYQLYELEFSLWKILMPKKICAFIQHKKKKEREKRNDPGC